MMELLEWLDGMYKYCKRAPFLSKFSHGWHKLVDIMLVHGNKL